MFLKSLTLKGFKSFADATTLDLEPGVTVVVGPNGSGKSNVVDAIAWVLGAQAPSAVRSQKMDDVIFAGTAKRPALGRAEVSLTIDNSAGLLPIEFTEVTVTRTLFRTGDSEYAINGVACRLLDVQELLSDSGVGRQQHVIVSQGQIDAVLNAKSEDRRGIIEEAAGVLKFRKRKERSERRLESTEANLLRLQDLLREVRRQLRPLERQADAARRHGEVVAEVNGLRLFLAGRELASLRSRLDTGARDRQQLTARETELKLGLARLDADVMAAESQLIAHGGADVSDALGRCESLRERAKGLAAVLTERLRSIDRDRAALLGADVIASLEAESAQILGELTEVERTALDLGPAAEDVALAEAGLDVVRAQVEEGDETPATDSRGSAIGAAAEVRGELVAMRTAADQGEADLSRANMRLAQLASRRIQLAEHLERLRAECDAIQGREPELVEAADLARSHRHDAEDALKQAESIVRTSEADLRSAEARRDALAMALDEARAKAGAERLADVQGVVGTLLDVVVVDDGWETAFEAAAGEALMAVVVDAAPSARQALEALQRAGATGAVLSADTVASHRVVVNGGVAVRAHVRGRSALANRLLDRLLDVAVCVDGDWRDALDVALVEPDAVVVTHHGDRFGRGGWRIGTAGSGATAAALDDAKQRVEVITIQLDHERILLDQTQSKLAALRHRESATLRELDEIDTRFTSTSNGLTKVQGEQVAVSAEVETIAAQRDDVAERVRREQQRIAELAGLLPALEAAESEETARATGQRVARGRLAERVAAVAALRRDLEVRAASLEQRRQMLQRRLADVENRLRLDADERAEAEQRRSRLDRTRRAVVLLQELVSSHLVSVETELAVAREARRQQSDAARVAAEHLDTLRRGRARDERELEQTRERTRRAELEEAEVRLRLEAAAEMVRRDLDTEPDVAVKTECPPLPEGVNAVARARELERDLKLMGPINPLALEEFTALQERHDFLETQLADVQETRRELTKVIRAIDAEIQSVFAAAYADVSSNFATLFAMLFPGGIGKLVLTQPDDLLNTGIEVEAKPSGKNVKKLSLLSGGERSLTALAFLFAVFRSRPSPFYVMDEVEAALDDVNLHRFLGLIDEFRDDAQLLVVSHQKRTMEAADCLFGVTMQPGGSSKVVSEKVASSA